MTTRSNKKMLWLYGITLVTSFIILIDFIIPGTAFVDEEVSITRNIEKYYNAGGNSHNTYEVITSQHQFSVSEDFAKLVSDQKIKYSVSLIFKEINRYGLYTSEKSEIYSFRIASGLVLPLLVIVALVIAYKYEGRINILLSVLQIVLLLNLILLMQ